MKLLVAEIEDELLNHSKMTMKGWYALSILYKINIVYVWDRKYMEIMVEENEKYHLICQKNKQDAYAIECPESKQQLR